jgi:hypothetical protein
MELDEQVKQMFDVLKSIEEMTDYDNPDSYAMDDPHNCLEVIADEVRAVLKRLEES